MDDMAHLKRSEIQESVCMQRTIMRHEAAERWGKHAVKHADVASSALQMAKLSNESEGWEDRI